MSVEIENAKVSAINLTSPNYFQSSEISIFDDYSAGTTAETDDRLELTTAECNLNYISW